MKSFDLSATLREVKHYLKENWLQGAECPACNQFVKMYKHKINGIAVSDLIRLYKLTESSDEQYHHISHFSRDRGGAFAKLVHWGLAESQINEDTSKRTSGMWAITEKGKRFVQCDIEVPQYAYLYNSECKAMSPNTVDVTEALGTKFDYAELMAVKY